MSSTELNSFVARESARWHRSVLCGLTVLSLALLALGCRQDMHDQPRYEPLEPSTFFSDGQSARQPVEGTVARGQLKEDTLLYTGRILGQAESSTGEWRGFTDVYPFEITREVLDRGEERYNIYCAVCHDRTGGGNGMVVRRGFSKPTALYDPRLKRAPAGYLFDVITKGFGAMPDYASEIRPEDRWAVVAYLRALQVSQRATVDELPPEERTRLQQESRAPAGGAVDGGQQR